MNPPPLVFCVVDLDRFATTGFTVVQSPARVLASYDLGPPISLDLVADKMLDIQRAHDVKSFWVDGEVEACRFLQRFYKLPVRRVGPV